MSAVAGPHNVWIRLLLLEGRPSVEIDSTADSAIRLPPISDYLCGNSVRCVEMAGIIRNRLLLKRRCEMTRSSGMDVTQPVLKL
jgi:hypothetical protein